MVSVSNNKRYSYGEDDIVALAQQGDSKAYEELFLTFKPFLYRQARRYAVTSNRYDVDDIFGIGCEAFVKAVKDFDQDKGFKFITLLGTYFFNYYNSRFYEKEKRSRKYESLTGLDDVVGIGETGDGLTVADTLESDPHDDTQLYIQDIQEVYKSLLNNMSDRDKDIVTLYINGKFQQKDIASKYNISDRTVSKIVNDFRKKLKRELIKLELI